MNSLTGGELDTCRCRFMYASFFLHSREFHFEKSRSFYIGNIQDVYWNGVERFSLVSQIQKADKDKILLLPLTEKSCWVDQTPSCSNWPLWFATPLTNAI